MYKKKESFEVVFNFNVSYNQGSAIVGTWTKAYIKNVLFK